MNAFAAEACARQRGLARNVLWGWRGTSTRATQLQLSRADTVAVEEEVQRLAPALGRRILGRPACPHHGRVEAYEIDRGRCPRFVEARVLPILAMPDDYATDPSAELSILRRRVLFVDVARRRVRAAKMKSVRSDDPRTWPDGRLDRAIAAWANVSHLLRDAGPLAYGRQIRHGAWTPDLAALSDARDGLLAWSLLASKTIDLGPISNDAACVAPLVARTLGRLSLRFGIAVDVGSLWRSAAADRRRATKVVTAFARTIYEFEDALLADTAQPRDLAAGLHALGLAVPCLPTNIGASNAAAT